MTSSHIENRDILIETIGEVIDDDGMCKYIGHVLSFGDPGWSVLVGVICFCKMFAIDGLPSI